MKKHTQFFLVLLNITFLIIDQKLTKKNTENWQQRTPKNDNLSDWGGGGDI